MKEISNLKVGYNTTWHVIYLIEIYKTNEYDYNQIQLKV